VVFKQAGQVVTHKGLVILAGPIREQLRRSRQEQLTALEHELSQLQVACGY
jgi:hypothetical protein